MREDLKTWKIFLEHPVAFCRGFMDFETTWLANEIDMYSDASHSEILGFGATCQSSWMSEMWPNGYIKNIEPSIEYLELFGVVAAVHKWVHRFRNKRIVLFCDNTSVVAMIN